MIDMRLQKGHFMAEIPILDENSCFSTIYEKATLDIVICIFNKL